MTDKPAAPQPDRLAAPATWKSYLEKAREWRLRELELINGVQGEWIGVGYSGLAGGVWSIRKDFAAFDEALAKLLVAAHPLATFRALAEKMPHTILTVIHDPDCFRCQLEALIAEAEKGTR